MAAAENVKRYQVRLARSSSRKYHVMRFKQKVELAQLASPTMARRERESEEEEVPTHGEGSEFGRKRREASRRRKRGYGPKDADPDDQPWELKEGRRNGKLFTGRKEGGVNTSSAYYMMRQCADGAFEAIPITSWYNFSPGIQYNTFNAEEAEEQYLLKHKTLNYFSLMLSKKMQSHQEGEGEGEGEGGSATRKLRVTDNDGGRGNSSDEEGPLTREDNEEGEAGKAKQRHHKGKRPPRKSRVGSGGESSGETTDDGEMESREVDYISDDSTESEREEKEDERQMADAQQRGKSAESDRSDGEEEEEEEEEAELTEAGREINALIKKQQSVDAPSSDEGEGEGEGVGDSVDQNPVPPVPQGTKRPLEDSGEGKDPSQPLAKRVHVEDNPGVITDKEVLHYLARKPITTKDLVRKFQRRKTAMDKKQVVASLGSILPRLNVEKKEIKDKIYLSLRPST